MNRNVIYAALLALASCNGNTPAHANGTIHVVSKPMFACPALEDLLAVGRVAASGDRSALMSDIVMRGCTILNGERVFVEDRNILGGTVRVRVEGTVRRYWTIREVIERLP